MQRESTPEAVVREITRRTRKKYSLEEKIRIILEGLKGETSIAELCRREGLNPNVYYKWSREFLEAAKKRLQGDTVREATSMKSNIFKVICFMTISFTIGLSCVHSSFEVFSRLPNIGDTLPCKHDQGSLYMISAGQLSHGCRTDISGVQFFFASDENQQINYLSTNDDQFKTPEGIHIGSTYNDVRSVHGSEIVPEPGWAYDSILPSGWNVKYGGIPGVDSMGGVWLIRDSVVHEVFRR